MRAAVLFSFLGAVIATWPTVLHPSAAVLGHPGNDVWNHIWGYWWVAEEVLAGRVPLATDLMHFPGTSALFFIDTFGALLLLPVTVAFGPVVSINLVMFLCFWSAGLGAWALGRHVLGEVRGYDATTDRTALFAAAAYAFSPHLLAQAYNGITETLFAAGLPLTTLAALRLYERPSFSRALVAGSVGAISTIANWYYGLFSFLAAGILLLAFALARREQLNWRMIPGSVGLAGVFGGLLVAPVLMGFASTLDGESAIVARDPKFVWDSLVNHNITDMVSLFRPGKVYSPDLKVLSGEDLLIVTYIGWVLLALGVSGLWGLHRWRDRVPWLAWIAVFFLLTLGPYLHIDGGYITFLDRRIPLPFLALFDALPVFQRISHPFRFVTGVQLGLAMLALYRLADLRPWAWIPATAALAVECLLLSPAPWPIARSATDIPEYVALLREDPVPGAVLDLPASLPNLERAVYLYWQTLHGRPSPYSLNEPLPPMLARNHLSRAVLVAEGGRLDRLPPVLGDLDLVVSGRALRDIGVRYVVMHEGLYPVERRAQVLALLRVGLGPETLDTGKGERIWRLEPRPGDPALVEVLP